MDLLWGTFQENVSEKTCKTTRENVGGQDPFEQLTAAVPELVIFNHGDYIKLGPSHSFTTQMTDLVAMTAEN